MNRTKTFLLSLFLAATLTTAGLVAAPQPQASEPADDEVLRVAAQVQRSIVTLSNYGVFDDINFGIGRGEKGLVVILKGHASRPTLRTSAERVTKGIEGVGEVINQIEVLPLSSNDDQIRTEVYEAIYGHTFLSRYNPNRGTPLFASIVRMTSGLTNDPPQGFHPIHIIVKNGHVALEGVVDTAGDKTIAGMETNSVFGVFGVTNDLVVANQPEKKK